MAQPTPPSAGSLLERGLEHHRAGQLAQAETLYRQALAQQPDHPGALHLLGLLACDCNQPASAVQMFDRAIALNPGVADFHFHRASALETLGRLAEAVAAYTSGLAIEPNYAEALSNLGNLLVSLNRPEEAVQACRSAIALRPDLAAPHNNLGNALRLMGRHSESAHAYRAAVRLNPSFGDAALNLGNALFDLRRFPEAADAFRQAVALLSRPGKALNNLGNTLYQLGRVDEAESALRDAIARDPESLEPPINLGNLLTSRGKFDEAIALFNRAIALRSDVPETYSNLGNALVATGRLVEAADAFRRAIALRPGFGIAHTNLGHALLALCQPREAVAGYRRAVELLPDLPQVRSNLLYGLHFVPEIDAETIYQEHLEYGRQVRIEPIAHDTPRDLDRRLRIGFVSPDFHHHPVGRFVLPLFEHHDRDRFEFIAFAETASDDQIARALKQNAEGWHVTLGRTDADLVRLIRDQKIDILIDLAAHTAQNRLPVFAARPAPVSATWLGYPNTTGLRSIDYRLTDEHADPIGQTESLHTEALLRLPRTAWCFSPPQDSPEPSASPSERSGHITFGSFNNLGKLNDRLMELWARVLRQVPDSRLLLKASSLRDASARRHVLDAFAAHGIPFDRIELLPPIEGMGPHLAAYARVDIALDTFPYHGTTTTCEALWMGVPVVTLAGRAHVSRVGVSLLSQVGLGESIAGSAGQYVAIAAALADDRIRLGALRAGLRERMRSSPLMNAVGFTRAFESALHQMWQNPINRH